MNNQYDYNQQQNNYQEPYPDQTIDLRAQHSTTPVQQEQAYGFRPSENQQVYQQPEYQHGYYQQPPTINVFNNNVNNNVNNSGYYGPWVSYKNRWVAFFLCLFLGYIGVHRFYAGKIGSGLLYLFTGGLFGIGYIVDLIMILCGVFTDRYGYQLK